MMNIEVLFFGVLADITGTGRKQYRDVTSFSDLKYRIEDEFPEIVHYTFRVALNNEIVNEEPAVKDGDEIAFLPPFAGG